MGPTALPLDTPASRAQFHLLLLNAADPRTCQLGDTQQSLMETAYDILNSIVILPTTKFSSSSLFQNSASM